jgi:hypothetical protein
MTSIRSSKPITVTPNALKLAPSSLQEEIHLFLEARNILGIQVSQPIRTLEQISSNQKIFVGSRLGPVPSGFLILRSDSPVVYWNTKIGSAHIVRINLDRRQLEKIGSAVLSATYYGTERRMILEDVLYYNNSFVYNDKTFLERWNIMKNICRLILRPDVSGVQGFDLSVAKYISLSEWLKQSPLQDGIYMCEFITDKPRWRRLLWRSERPPAAAVVVEASKPQLANTATAAPMELVAVAEKDTTLNLPDSYVLYAEGHKLIGPAAIRKLTISLALRAAIALGATISVRVEYNETFKKYEVVEVLDSSQAQIAPAQAFEKRT